MRCIDAEAAVAYLGGDLDHEQSGALALHVADCDACRATLEGVSAMVEDVRRRLSVLDHSGERRLPPGPEQLMARGRLRVMRPREVSADATGSAADTLLRGWTTSRMESARGRHVAFVLAGSILLAAAAYGLWSSAPVVSAETLVARAAEADAPRAGFARRQSYVVEERRSADRALVSQRQIETWGRSSDPGPADAAPVRVRRVVDDNGARVVPDVALIETLDPRDYWRLDPGPAAFAALVDLSRATVEEGTTNYTVAYAADSGPVHAATLVLSKPDLTFVRQELVVADGIAWQFVVVAVEHVPWSAEVAKHFTPLPAPAPRTSPSADAPARLDVSTLAALEADLYLALDRARAVVTDEVRIDVSVAGALHVHGLVESPARRRILADALSVLAGEPGVYVDLVTVDETLQQRSAPSPTVVIAASGDPRLPPGWQALRSAAPSDEAALRMANDALDAARALLQHTSALRRLVDAFGPARAATLDARRATSLEALGTRHGTEAIRQADRLRADLAGIFQVEDTQAQSLDPLDEARTAHRVLELAVRVDDAVRQSLASSNGEGAETPPLVTSPAFWLALDELVRRLQTTDRWFVVVS